jgi:hypothetical protein
MCTDRFDDLLRSLAGPLSRRGVARTVSGLAVAGPLGVLGFTEADAKRNTRKRKKKRRRKNKHQPFCAGKNLCAGGDAICGTGSAGFPCTCHVTVAAGKPYCAESWTEAASCGACSAGQTCIDLTGCTGQVACATPCADPE